MYFIFLSRSQLDCYNDIDCKVQPCSVALLNAAPVTERKWKCNKEEQEMLREEDRKKNNKECRERSVLQIPAVRLLNTIVLYKEDERRF